MSDLSAKSEFLIYEAENGAIKIEVRFEGETVRLAQQLMEREVDGLSGQIIAEATA